MHMRFFIGHAESISPAKSREEKYRRVEERRRLRFCATVDARSAFEGVASNALVSPATFPGLQGPLTLDLSRMTCHVVPAQIDLRRIDSFVDLI